MSSNAYFQHNNIFRWWEKIDNYFKNKAGSLYTASLLWTNNQMRIVIDTIKNKTGESNQIRSDGDVDIILYQIRRPLGLAFAISFVGWENCCCSIFRGTLICSSLPQSPDLLVFPATYPPPPPTHRLWDLTYTWTLTMEGSAWLSWPVHRTLALVLYSQTFTYSFYLQGIILLSDCLQL